MPRVAGVLEIISGIFALIGGITVATLDTKMTTLVAGYVMVSIEPGVTPNPAAFPVVIGIIAAVLIFLGIISVLGGISTVKRSFWGFALAGAIFAFIYLPPLGIPAIILVALSKPAFSS